MVLLSHHTEEPSLHSDNASGQPTAWTLCSGTPGVKPNADHLCKPTLSHNKVVEVYLGQACFPTVVKLKPTDSGVKYCLRSCEIQHFISLN